MLYAYGRVQTYLGGRVVSKAITYTHMGLRYKVGRHGLLFVRIEGKWVRSSKDKAVVLGGLKLKQYGRHKGVSDEHI